MKYAHCMNIASLFLVSICSFSLAMHEPIELDSLQESLLTVEEQEAYQIEEEGRGDQRKELGGARCYRPHGDSKKLSKIQQKLMRQLREGQGVVLTSLRVGSSDFADENGNTPMMVAAEHGNNEALQGMLQFIYATMNKQNNEGYTALMLAAKNGHMGAVELLFGYHTILDPNIKNSNGFTALDLAIKNRQKKVVNYLLSSTNPEIVIDENTFMSAVSAADIGTLSKLLEKRAGMSREQKDAISRTKILAEVDRIIVETKQNLREQGISNNDRAELNNFQKKQEKIAEALISYGAQRTTPNQDTFMIAISDADPKRLSDLLRYRKSMRQEERGAISRRKLLKWANQLIEEAEQRLINLQEISGILNKHVVSPVVDDGSGVGLLPEEFEDIAL